MKIYFLIENLSWAYGSKGNQFGYKNVQLNEKEKKLKILLSIYF